jgi:hypothetical protein
MNDTEYLLALVQALQEKLTLRINAQIKTQLERDALQEELTKAQENIEQYKTLFPQCYMDGWREGFGHTENYKARRAWAKEEAAIWLAEHLNSDSEK